VIVQSKKVRLYFMAVLAAVAFISILLAGSIGAGNAHRIIATLFAGFIVLLRVSLQIFRQGRDRKLVRLS
jgi:hypothetical protein